MHGDRQHKFLAALQEPDGWCKLFSHASTYLGTTRSKASKRKTANLDNEKLGNDNAMRCDEITRQQDNKSAYDMTEDVMFVTS
jgi:hypothetical protein